MKPIELDFTIRFRLLIVFAVVMALLVGLVSFIFVKDAQREVIQHQALTIAEVVAKDAAASRAVYSRFIAEKLKRDGFGPDVDSDHRKGFVPIPAQFFRLVGQAASENSGGLYRYKPVSKWSLREEHQLSDEFSRWAWEKLEAQDLVNPSGPIPWKAVWRVENVNGVNTLRYMRADPASSESCVACHNKYEAKEEIVKFRKISQVAPGKQWKLYQLIGATQVDIPLSSVEKIAYDHRQKVMVWTISVLSFGLLFIAWFIFHDVSQARSKAFASLSWQARHDALTGLANRYEFEYQLDTLLKNPGSENRKHVICYVDLDQFKVVNDTCGHTAGDELLKQLAELLQANLRSTDTLARLGGDEFGVLLRDCPANQAVQIAENLIKSLNDFCFVWTDKTFTIRASIGLAVVQSSTRNIVDVLSAADMACYAAKESGRNRVHLYQEDDVDLSRRHGEMQWISKITQGLEERRFRLYCQTILPIQKQSEYEHQEILIRLTGDDGKMIPPNMFLPAAERYNLMPNIDRWVITTMFSTYAQHRGAKPYDGKTIFSINLSGASINDKSFLEFVCKQLRVYSVPAHVICFEITESVAIGNIFEARKFIKELKQQGCRFALDDFGNGLSSFGYLKNLPVDYLKIDGSFVRDILDDSIDCSMVAAINQIGHVMGIETVAEFVENQTILEKLREIGVDYAQGYAIEQPKPLALVKS